MGRSLVVASLALVGLLCAAGMGVAAYVVSRDSVAVPVTRLQPKPQALTPARVRRAPKARPRRTRPVTTATRTAPTPTAPTTTVDDHRGRSGGGDDNSGPGGGGGGGHGGDD